MELPLKEPARRSLRAGRAIFVGASIALGVACSSASPPVGASPSSERVIVEGFGGAALDPRFAWVREAPAGWRLRDGALELDVLPGSLWCAANDAQNVLVFPLPSRDDDVLALEARLELAPTAPFEQVVLAVYENERTMVKVARELVDGKTVIVLGSETDDACRTIAAADTAGPATEVRLVLDRARVVASHRASADEAFHELGEATLGARDGAAIYASVHAYNGAATATPTRARIDGFRVVASRRGDGG